MSQDQLFKKAVVFGDIHFGYKNDSRQFNIDCENFISWMIQVGQEWGADTCIFLGDWHHNRARINASTLLYSISNFERLSAAFPQTYLITGNHDLYYRDKREVNSIEFGGLIDNIEIINEPTNVGGCSLVPFLVGDEWKKVQSMSGKYCFGHFELPKFKMNAMVEMPDHGEISLDDLGGFEMVFSGHFHKRQVQKNVIYIGNCFPHNFADVDDDERGCMLLEWDKKPEFRAWSGAPKYRKTLLSTLLENPESVMDENTYLRAEIDVFLNFEEASYVKDVLIETFNPRELQLLPQKKLESDVDEFNDDINFESVDSVVLSHLSNIVSDNIDANLLMEIYRSLGS